MGQKSAITLQDRLSVDELSILNHELGNVLHGLSGMAGLLRDSGLTTEQVRWLEAIEQSGRQMGRIMDSTLVYRGVAGPGAGVRTRRMNGVELLEDVIISHAPAALEKGLELVLVTDPHLPPCWYSDCGLLRQLLDNLVGNAIKFTVAGYVVLRAGQSQQGDLMLQVCDSGPGITQPEGVFDRGQRGAAAADLPGCGLGLYVCRRIVESLGGSLAVKQEPTGGSRFDARFPVTFESRRGDSAAIRSLTGLVCRLRLKQPMLESVQGFLARLGVEWSSTDRQPVCAAGPDEIRLQQENAGLRLTWAGPGPDARAVFLAAPVLESGLEQALFQLLLQRRFDVLTRSEKPG